MESEDVLWEGEIDEDGAQVDVRVRRLSVDDCITEMLVKGQWVATDDSTALRIFSKAVIELEAMT